MKRDIIYLLITILFLSTFASAQFSIPIPKLPTIDREKVKTPEIPGNSQSPGSSKGKNRQMVIDDGYTFFEATPVTEYSQQYRGDVSKGWALYPYLRVFGTFPNNSGFNVVVSKNGKALSKFYCEGKPYRKSEDYAPGAKTAPDDDYMMNEGCANSSKFVAESGTFDVHVFAVNGDTDKATALRTYKIEVKEAKKIRPGNIPGITDYFIQRHAEAPASILYLRPGGGGNTVKHNYHNITGGTTLKGNVDILFNVAITYSAIQFSGTPYVRCSVNGERVNFQNNGEIKEASVRGDTVKWERDGKAPQFLGFYQYWINLPIKLNSDGRSGNPDMTKKTGNWECELRNGNQSIRKFKWTVGGDGYPVEHAEQKSGNINLPWGAYLIETEFPVGENSIEERLMPMRDAGLFYGIPWKSEEGRKMAGSVPKVGEPYFIP